MAQISAEDIREALREAYDRDWDYLDRSFDRIKSRAFMGKNGAFLGPLLCELQFIWSFDVETTATDGKSFWFNPDFFESLPIRTREMVLMHELWHVGLLHSLRLGNRKPEEWNWATDIVINNGLIEDGYSFEGLQGYWADKKYTGKDAEFVYDDLMKNPPPPSCKGGSFDKDGKQGDLVPTPPTDVQATVNAVVRAMQSARLSGNPGAIPGEVQQTIDKFLAPKIKWERHLWQFFHEVTPADWSWSKPNRRHEDIYLPSIGEEDCLDNLMYFLDVSGSVSDKDVLRFNSEVKHVKDHFNPKKLTLVQFDTIIQKVDILTEEDDFDEIQIISRGGTCLVPVRDMIIKERPKAVIIFSDLFVEPMRPIAGGPPILWVAVGNKTARVPQGRLIHIGNET